MSQPAPAANEKSKTSEPPFVPVPVVPQYIEEALLDRLKKKARGFGQIYIRDTFL
jgi:hypothetical protein